MIHAKAGLARISSPVSRACPFLAHGRMRWPKPAARLQPRDDASTPGSESAVRTTHPRNGRSPFVSDFRRESDALSEPRTTMRGITRMQTERGHQVLTDRLARKCWIATSPPCVRRQGRHTAQCSRRVQLERLGDRHLHRERTPEAAEPARQPDGCPDNRHRGASAQDSAHPRSSGTGRCRWNSGGIPPDERQLQMTPEQRVEWEAGVRSLYDGMVRIV